MTLISSDVIFDGKGNVWTDHLLEISNTGEIKDIRIKTSTDVSTHYDGAICPGFINAHCHLELSHLKGEIPTNTGLVKFIEQVVTLRSFPEEEIQSAIKEYLDRMWSNGIVAVGDISNTIDTVQEKLNSPIRFYNFIECFDLFQPHTGDPLDNFLKVFDAFKIKEGDKKNMVPHAPYSVSPALLKSLLGKYQNGDTISIHNQETPDENNFTASGTGALIAFYKNLNIPLDSYKPTGKRSINYAGEYLNHKGKTLFVHNTMSEEQDFSWAEENINHPIWCSCPNANLYIEGKLPDYELWSKMTRDICIGTDSLSSNFQLNIWEEVKTIHSHSPQIPLKELIRWACINGACALGFDKNLGSIEVGKTPGLVHLSHTNTDHISSHSTSKKIA